MGICTCGPGMICDDCNAANINITESVRKLIREEIGADKKKDNITISKGDLQVIADGLQEITQWHPTRVIDAADVPEGIWAVHLIAEMLLEHIWRIR